MFASDAKLFDENLRIADMNINFIAVNSKQDKKCKNIPANSLIRYQYIEILIRNSKDKYMSPGICDNWADAVKKIVDYLLPYFKKFAQ